MKSKFSIIAGAGLMIVVLVVILGLVGLSTVFASSQSGQVNFITPQINVQATAQAIRFQNRQAELQLASQERIYTLQTQITRTAKLLGELENRVHAQSVQQNIQLVNLQNQIVREQSTAQPLQESLARLQQEMISQEDSHKIKLATLNSELRQVEAERLAELQTVLDQLQAAQIELDAPATITVTTIDDDVSLSNFQNSDSGHSSDNRDESSEQDSDEDDDDDYDDDKKDDKEDDKDEDDDNEEGDEDKDEDDD